METSTGPRVLAPFSRLLQVAYLTMLYNFCSQSQPGCAEMHPNALIQGTDGSFYGTTFGETTNSPGTVFRITPAGALTTLYTFCSQSGCDDGEYPSGTLVQETSGAFYGTTSAGGIRGDGTVFRLLVGLGPFVENLPGAGKAGAPVEILGTGLKNPQQASCSAAYRLSLRSSQPRQSKQRCPRARAAGQSG